MAVNQNHSESHGVIIPPGESLLKCSPDVDLSFPQPPPGSNFFSGTKRGKLFLTSHRVIFVTSHSNDPMLSFTMPFHLMSNFTVEQPVFGANYIKGTIQAAPDGGWEGSTTFKVVFRKGGAIDFAQLLVRAASAAAYGVPPPGYGVPPPGYGVPPPGYDVSPPGYGAGGYGSPPPIYVATPAGYGVPPPRYGAPSVRHGSPPPGYRAPTVEYGAPPPGYGTTPVGSGSPPPRYEASPVEYGTPPSGYGSMPPGSRVPPAVQEVPPAESEAGHPISVEAQTPEFQAAFPSTSSSKAHSPPSKM